MKLYSYLYRSCLIRIESAEFFNPSRSNCYYAEGYNPESGDQFLAFGSSDTEALHKLRGQIDHEYGKYRIAGN